MVIFETGFAAAAVSESFTQFGVYEALGVKSSDLGIGDIAWNIVASGTVGGASSVVTGGNFASGFQTAALGRLFNELYLHGRPSDEILEVRDDEVEICSMLGGTSHATVGYVQRGVPLQDDVISEMVLTGAYGAVRGLGSYAVRRLVSGGAKGSDKLVKVTRWQMPASESLKNGDWVVRGEKNVFSYLMSGKFTPLNRRFHVPYKYGRSFKVPQSTLKSP